MAVLLLVAVIAGAGAALSPCVLPVLPALLSTTASGGRRRPFGVVLGLAITFTLSIAVLASAVKGVGLGSSTLRDLSIAIVLGFGIVLLVPSLATRMERPLAGLSRLGPKSKGDGFWSGILVGGALGFVYTPCTGPILGAVVSLSASTSTTFRTLLLAIAYALGTAVVLLGLALGGGKLLARARTAFGGLRIQRIMGAVLVATALVMVLNLDVDLEQWISRHAPDVNLASALEKSKSVGTRLNHDVLPASRFQVAQAKAAKASATAAATAQAHGQKPAAAKLPVLGVAPEFVGNQDWWNTPGDRPITLKSLRGRVVLVDFWTYTCINCIRTLPYLEAWDRAYRSKGLTIVGVHSPEFTFEQDASNVKNAIKTDGIKYPVVQDNHLDTWQAYGNQYWPADYLIDPQGNVRAYHFGEGDYGTLEKQIRELLAARGDTSLGARAKPHNVVKPTSEATPETYLAEPGRSSNFPGQVSGRHDYGAAPSANPAPSEFRYAGIWTISGATEGATAGAGARLDANVFAKNTYVVLGTPDGTARKVRVLLDGKPISAADAGADVHHGVLTVTRQRLYSVISLPGDAPHVLTLLAAPGVQGYSFTFG
jgi:cytochrome c biogenesis protein CcdA/thiol-disulfide isomerase/thioredoxin